MHLRGSWVEAEYLKISDMLQHRENQPFILIKRLLFGRPTRSGLFLVPCVAGLFKHSKTILYVNFNAIVILQADQYCIPYVMLLSLFMTLLYKRCWRRGLNLFVAE